MHKAKDEVKALLKKLSDNCTIEDVQYHLYVIEKINRSIERVTTEETVSQKEVEKHFDKWTLK